MKPSTPTPIICLMGPTASGKTAASISLAQQFNAEIISVDSALIYRGMDIGSAKPSKAMQEIVPHHLIDIMEPTEAYSAADFVKDVHQLIDDIQARDRIPLLAGGTMMYFHALQQGLSQLPNSQPEVREALQQQCDEVGLAAMHAELEKVDPQSAKKIHPNDPQRILRALEVYQLSGQPLSSLQSQKQPRMDLQFLNIALMPEDRAALHQRIEQRFDDMLAEGFMDEMQRLYNTPALHADLPSMRSVGYRQAWQHLAGEMGFDEMREKAIQATRQLAKRQLTWCRHWPECEIFDMVREGELAKIESVITQAINPSDS